MTTHEANEKNYWIVVADEARAIVYARENKRSPLQESFRLDNPEARVKTGDLITDRGGRSFDSRGQGRHAMAKEKTDPKTQTATVFAKQLAQRVARAMQDGRCKEYAVVAAPRFLGLLRAALASARVADPGLSIDKEMVGRDVAAIEELLAREA